MTLKVHFSTKSECIVSVKKKLKIQILTEDYEEKHVFFCMDSIAWINCMD